MSILTSIFAGGVGEVFSGIGSLAKDIRSAITGEPSPEKMAEINKQLMELEFTAQKAQTDINLQEAKHPNVFVSGWRPFIGWVCGFSFAYKFIGHPVLIWANQVWEWGIEAPVLDTSGLMTLAMSLLGIGGMRTFEKMKGINGKH